MVSYLALIAFLEFCIEAGLHAVQLLGLQLDSVLDREKLKHFDSPYIVGKYPVCPRILFIIKQEKQII